MPSLSELLFVLRGDPAPLQAALRTAQRDLRATSQQFSTFGSALQTIGMNLTASVTMPLVGVGAAALKVSADMEQTRTAFVTMMGSTVAAQRHLEELRRFALRTPFQFAELTDASRRMQALGFAAEDVIPYMTRIGNAVSALGGGKPLLDRIVLALGQMQAKGKVTAEEMRQLAEAGIPAWQALAKALNTDVAGAMALVEKRAVDSQVGLNAILESMDRFKGGMEAQSRTLRGVFNQLQEQINMSLVEIGDKMAPTAKRIITELLIPLAERTKAAADAFSKMSPQTQNAALAMSAFAAVAPVVIVALGTVLRSIGDIAGALGKMSGALARAGGLIAAISRWSGVASVLFLIAAATKQVYDRWREIADDPFLNLIFAGRLPAQNTEAWAVATSKLVPPMSAAAKAALALSVAQKQKNDALKATTQVGGAAAETTKRVTLESLLAADALDRQKDAINRTVKSVNDMIFAGQGWGKAIEYAKVTIEGSLFSLSELKDITDAVVDSQTNHADILERLNRGWNEVTAIGGSYENVLAQIGITSQKTLDAEVTRLEILTQMLWEYFDAGKASATEVEAAFEKLEQAKQRAGQASEGMVQQTTANTKKAGDAWKGFGQQVSTVVTDLSRGIADVIFSGKKMGEMFRQIGIDIAKSLYRYLIEQGIRLAIAEIGKLISKLGSLGQAIGGIFGGASSAAGGVAGAAGSAAGSTAGGVSAAVGGALGVVSAIGSIGTMISGIIGNFQMARQENTLNAIEQSVRKTWITVGEGGESISAKVKAHLPFLNHLAVLPSIDLRSVRMVSLLEELVAVNRTHQGNITINVNGGSNAAQMAQDLMRELKRLSPAFQTT